jgi:hypothetical protein
MKISLNNEVSTPQAFIAVNKSRIKQYDKSSKTPIYYLQKGQEFQLELFNPTNGTILAKIYLNGNPISQGGLVLRPGERIFLDRYIDVSKKFLFDTYEVANTSEVKKAIEDNGDFKVEFYKEQVPNYYSGYLNINNNTDIVGTYYNQNLNDTHYNQNLTNYSSPNPYDITCSTNTSFSTSSFNSNTTPEGPNLRGIKKLKSKKSIETGRVEQGSTSNQKLKTVNKDFEYFPFHTLEYKMLPLSQKINTAEDINVKRYCTNCGSKLGKGDKFCSQCATKV